jgi:hypothetical protein
MIYRPPEDSDKVSVIVKSFNRGTHKKVLRFEVVSYDMAKEYKKRNALLTDENDVEWLTNQK